MKEKRERARGGGGGSCKLFTSYSNIVEIADREEKLPASAFSSVLSSLTLSAGLHWKLNYRVERNPFSFFFFSLRNYTYFGYFLCRCRYNIW